LRATRVRSPFLAVGCDAGETTPEQTALREAQEEIGIDPATVRVLGRLASLITISSFRVTPVVGVLEWPTVFRLNDQEVERVFTVPLAWLADSGNRWNCLSRVAIEA